MFIRNTMLAVRTVIQAFARHRGATRVIMSIAACVISRKVWEAARNTPQTHAVTVSEIFKLALAPAAVCTICLSAQAHPPPPGSYKDSCSNISEDGTTLEAICKTINQQDNNTTLSNYASCAGEIANVNGILTCEAARSAGTPTAAARATIGTSTDLRSATEALLTGFSRIAGGGASLDAARQAISVSDLWLAAQDRRSTYPKHLQDAAKLYLVSPVVRRFVSSHGGKEKPDGAMTKPALERMLALLSAGQFAHALLDGISGNDGYAAVLRDPGIPNETRDGLVRRLSDTQLLKIIGHPNVQGNAQDKAEETAAFLALAKVSWLGAAEAETLARYQVPFTIDRGSQDTGASFWNGQAMHLSERMVKGGAPNYMSEVLAHEGGHALYHKSGLKDKTFKDATDAKLVNGIDNIINEGFAGVFGNRAHVALFGHDNPDIDRHLVLLNDVSGNIASDSTAYAKYYHIGNTAAARMQIEDIKRIMSKDLLPYLQRDFNLLGDPQLAFGLLPAVQ